MANFSKQSADRLATAHPLLQKLCNEVIKEIDFVVLYGNRSTTEQFELFKQGRTLKNGVWIKTGKTVTNIDGKSKLSKHNYSPSLAVDLAPYPIDWNNIQRFKALSDVVKKVAKRLGINIVWGGDWKSFPDYPHFELKD